MEDVLSGGALPLAVVFPNRASS